jgi:hypothetical protein
VVPALGHGRNSAHDFAAGMAGRSTYNYQFSASQVSTLDFFHPSLSGQAALARVTWAASWWPST